MKIKLWKSTVCSVLLIQHLHKFNFKSSCSKCGYIRSPTVLLLLLNICLASTAAARNGVSLCDELHSFIKAVLLSSCQDVTEAEWMGKKKKSEQDSGEEKKTKTALKTLSAWRLFCEKEHGLALPNFFLMSLRSSSTVCLFSSLPPLLTHPPFISFKSVICILR